MRQLARKRHRMRRIDDHELVQGLRVRHGVAPGHGPAPVVRDQHEFLVPQVFSQLTDVLDQDARLVLLHLGRAVGQVETAQVGRHREMVAAELLELLFPAIPKLGKTVQEQDQRPLPGMGVVQTHAVDAGVVVVNLCQGRAVNQTC